MTKREMTQRILTALMYAVGAVVAAYQATTPPITAEGWIGLVIAFVVAFWGKFSTSTRVIAMDRLVWSAEQRKVEIGK